MLILRIRINAPIIGILIIEAFPYLFYGVDDNSFPLRRDSDAFE